MAKIRRLLDEYQFPGFRPRATIKGVFGDSKARVIQLERRQKKLNVDVVELCVKVFMIARSAGSKIYHAVKREFIWMWRYDG